MEQIQLIKRNDFFDVFYVTDKKRKKIGSGTWAYINTAVSFYNLEGLDVEVYNYG